MKLKDAETLLRLEKQKGPLTKYWSCETDEGILLEAWPLGFARGSFRLSDVFTVVPHYQYSALFEGGDVPHHIRVPRMGPNHLWEQEAFVYYKEMRAMMRKMVTGLDFAPVIPRVGDNDDRSPHPEDFALPFAPRPAIGWHYEGPVPRNWKLEVRRIQQEFLLLLGQFIEGETNGQGTTI